MPFQVTIRGETFEFGDDVGIRSAARDHAIDMVGMLKKNKELRPHFESFFADVYFATLKAGGLLALAQISESQSVPLEQFQQMSYIPAHTIVGEGEPTVTRELTGESNDESGSGNSGRGEAPRAEGGTVNPSDAGPLSGSPGAISLSTDVGIAKRTSRLTQGRLAQRCKADASAGSPNNEQLKQRINARQAELNPGVKIP